LKQDLDVVADCADLMCRAHLWVGIWATANSNTEVESRRALQRN